MSTVPDLLRGLVDDAALFPPASTPLADAMTAHAEHRSAPYADLVGPLVVADDHLPAVLLTAATARPTSDGPLGVVVVVTGGAGALEPAVAWATRSEQLALHGLEIAMRESDAGDIAPNARRIVAAVDALQTSGDLPDAVPVSVEAPRLHGQDPSPSWLGALDELASMDHRLKLRTGGEHADDFPGSHELATCIGAALDRELSFKCTAGLHHALRHRDPATGFEHHGFLNVLVATRASLDGAGPSDVATVLDETDAETLLGATDDAALAGARRWFTSFGCCSVSDPLRDLRDLGMLT